MKKWWQLILDLIGVSSNGRTPTFVSSVFTFSEGEVMRDLVGREISEKSVVAYANDSGFLSLAVVLEIKEEEKKLRVVKRGYQSKPIQRELVRPADVLIVDLWNSNLEEVGRPEEVEFIIEQLKEKE